MLAEHFLLSLDTVSVECKAVQLAHVQLLPGLFIISNFAALYCKNSQGMNRPKSKHWYQQILKLS